MRGHGGSAPGPDDCAMADFSNDVASVLDGLGIERVHYIGLSIGGMFGQTLALDHPNRLSSLMLCSTSPNAVPGGEGMWLERFNAVRAAGAVDPVADASMERWFTPAFKSRNPMRWKQVRDAISNTTIPGYITAAKAVMKFDVIDRLPRIATPTIVVCGDGDTGTPPAGNKLIAAQIPGARYIEIADARHLANVERREQFNRIMLDWLAARR
jgi:3-oxoadipate enol-lactonase